jgi:SulP family sulfate permease
MLRRSPPSRSPPENIQEDDDKSSQGGEEDEVDSNQGRLIITSNGVKMDATERTPLITKDAHFESQHPDWIRGQRDIEAQAVRRKLLWPNLRQVILWPKEKGYDIAKVVANPSAWDRKAIWKDAVMAPIECLPAVILGLLLNVLDALSYGWSFPNLHVPKTKTN